ncbi:MAG: glutamine--fructose-6-phosphate transaminase (isomerizing) [Pseudomonadota bacterium]
MCGIIGVLGTKPVAREIIEGLKRLEYRGYDSAGVATVVDGAVVRRRAVGKLVNLEGVLEHSPLDGVVGVGHTRWATHGAPTEANAHPHATEHVALVHNGIIENFKILRDELQGYGRRCETETDTEVIVQLITHYLEAENLSPDEAFRTALGRLDGAFAIAAVFKAAPDLIFAGRKGSPLAVGQGQGDREGDMFLGSDAYALAPFTNRVTYLEEGDWAILSREGFRIYDAANKTVTRDETVSDASAALVDKGGYRHFMAKEIHEQPEVAAHTLGAYVDTAAGTVRGPGGQFDFKDMTALTMTACGTAYYAALVSKYWFERWARLPVDIDVASELRYRQPPMQKGGGALFISQSGETADTLAALRYAKDAAQKTAGVVNVPESSIAREADHLFRTYAGPEIGVASTKAFTCQLTTLATLAIAAGRARNVLSADDEADLVTALMETPRLMSEALQTEGQAEAIAHDIAKATDVLYIGRGVSYPMALEGALKLKEISYIHAEGYAAGELKHGPIALIDETTPVIVIAPMDDLFEKTVSNMQEVIARGGKAVLITDARGAEVAGEDAWRTLIVPDTNDFLSPLVTAIPVQLLAYHTAVAKGTDVDQPRNLAKSVTVE